MGFGIIRAVLLMAAFSNNINVFCISKYKMSILLGLCANTVALISFGHFEMISLLVFSLRIPRVEYPVVMNLFIGIIAHLIC